MTEISQIIRYLFVGGLITAADAAIYQGLTGRTVRMGRIRANLISTTMGMLLGFSLHFLLVFHPNVPRVPSRLLRYVVTVGCSVYAVQNIVIHFCAGKFDGAAALLGIATRPVASTGLDGDSMDRLIGKGMAAGVGMVWNFVLFKLFVYA